MLLVLLGLFMLVTAVAFVPLTVELVVDRDERVRLAVTPRWGWLKVAPEGHAPVEAAARPSDRRHETSDRDTRRRNSPKARAVRGVKKASWRSVRRVLSTPDFLPSLRRLLTRLLRSLRPRQTHLELVFGTGDPMETGQVWGALAPFVVVLLLSGVQDVHIQPDFLHRSFELHARTIVRIIPGVLLGLIAGYLATPAPWRALRNYARA